MTLSFLPAAPRKTTASLPSNAVILWELGGQSNPMGTNSFESDQAPEVRELWQGVEDFAWIWSRVKTAIQNDPDAINLPGNPHPSESEVDQWRPMTAGYGQSGARPWESTANQDAIGSERVVSWWLRSFFGVERVYCLKCCRGGTSINDRGVNQTDYNPTSAPKSGSNVRMWDVWKDRYRVDALPALRAQVGAGVPVYHAGHVWLQGAADMQPQVQINNYPASLDQIIAGIRGETPNVPIALGRSEDYFREDGTFEGSHIGVAAIRAAQEAKAASTANCELFSTDACDFHPDLEHFNGIGQWKLGVSAAHSIMTIDAPVLLSI